MESMRCCCAAPLWLPVADLVFADDSTKRFEDITYTPIRVAIEPPSPPPQVRIIG
jgi:hypothetical protein